MSQCRECRKQTKRSFYIYCSNRCQIDCQYKKYIQNWKNGLEDGNRGITAKTISKHLRRFLVEKYGNQCSRCGRCEKHPITRRVPLEIDHMDGDAENNKEKNLRLVCPNCHALTPNFRNLNYGKGRQWRIKYLKNLK